VMLNRVFDSLRIRRNEFPRGFGFSPQLPFLKEVIRLIELNWIYFKDRSYLNPKEAILSLTGPRLFSRQ
jgi:hypothetical protein